MSLPPSRFGEGFTVGGGAATPAGSTRPAVAPAGAPPNHTPAAPSGPQLAPAGEMNPLAAVAFVSVLLLGPLVAALSIPMALVARAQINRRGQGGNGLVIATLAVSVIYLAFGVVVLLLLLYTQRAGGVGTP